MGYASYTLSDGREAGYAIEATCDEEGCTARIDRGLGYLCGDTPGGDEYGCGGYFCGEHLYSGPDHIAGGQCQRCLGNGDDEVRRAAKWWGPKQEGREG